MLGVHRNGYYAWLKEPASVRDKDDQRLPGLIKHSWLESGSVYGHRKVTTDLRELGETCSRHRVARLMKSEGRRAMFGYGRRPRPLSGPVGSVAKNVLARGFKVREPNRASRRGAGRRLPVCPSSPNPEQGARFASMLPACAKAGQATGIGTRCTPTSPDFTQVPRE